MKRLFLILFIVSSFTLAACQLQENYSMNYRFGGDIAAEPKFVSQPKGFDFSVPLVNVSCVATKLKARLDRTGDTFTLLINDSSSDTKKCSQQFVANIGGIPAGTYQLKVVLDQSQARQTLFDEAFVVAE